MVRKFEFYEECASQWYDRLQSKDKALMRELTNDIINKPHQYLDVYSRNVNKILKRVFAEDDEE